MTRFGSRNAAGMELAQRLDELAVDAPVVIAIPKGGVPVAEQVAGALGAPLDVADVHEITAHRDDLSIGSITSEDHDEDIHRSAAAALGVDTEELDDAVAAQRRALRSLLGRVRQERPEESIAGRAVIIVDDGLLVGSGVAAAVAALRQRGASRVVVAVPVGAHAYLEDLRDDVDDVVFLDSAERVDLADWYDDLSPVSDDDVIDALRRAAR